MINSFYNINTNPDNDENVILQEFSNGDTIRILSTDSESLTPIEGTIATYNLQGRWGYSEIDNSYFRVGVGYILRTQTDGWFKVTSSKIIFDWEEQ